MRSTVLATNQHKGAIALDSTEANWLDFDSTGNITADEIPELLYKLKSQYRVRSSWFMHNDVEGYLRKIRDTSLFAFQPVMDLAAGLTQWNSLLGRPLFNENNMDSSLGTGDQVMVVGDFSKYALVERKGLVVSRNPYLYQANWSGRDLRSLPPGWRSVGLRSIRNWRDGLD